MSFGVLDHYLNPQCNMPIERLFHFMSESSLQEIGRAKYQAKLKRKPYSSLTY